MMRLWLILVLLTLSGTLLAQSPYVPPCPSAALDATFQGVDGPDHTYTLAINLRNISVETCFVDTTPQGTRVSTALPGGRLPFAICHYCEQGSQEPSVTQINLAPGESVHQTRSWRTAPVDPTEKCVSPTRMSWAVRYGFHSSFWLSSPSLLKPICSQLATTDYAAGEFLPEETPWPRPGWRTPVMHWANDENVSYSREHIPLRVTVDDPDHVLSRDEHSCPRLFVRVRDVDASRDPYRLTRVDEIQVACQEEPNGALTIDFDASYALKITPELERTVLNQSDELGEYTVDVSALADDKSSLAESDGHYHLVNTTDRLQLSMVDGKFIRRNWDQPVEGVAVSLTLDRDVYDVGGVVPLHIAVKNVDSRKKIAVRENMLLWAKGNTNVSVELQGPGGPRVLSLHWMGEEYCRHLMPGLLYPIEVPLSGEAYPPGIYRAVAVWKPSRNGNCGGPIPADFFTVRSRPVVFRIVEPRHPGVLAEPGSTAKK